MDSSLKDSRLLLALQAIKQSENLSVRQAATLYKVNRGTLQNRMNGRRARQDTRANSSKLKELEENALLQYILDLDARGFPLRLADVEDMANVLEFTRQARYRRCGRI